MNFKWSDALFLPEEDWNKDTKGMVLDPNDVEDEMPKEAKKKQLIMH